MILITGGSGSGKSAFAEDRVVQQGLLNRIYIATMIPYDEESHRRIERHRDMRKDKGFKTIECYTNLRFQEDMADSVVLLECMSNLVANELYAPEGKGEFCETSILKAVREIDKNAKELIIVTNEIFSHTNCYGKEMETYQKVLGQVNQGISSMAREVYEVVYGIPICYKKRI